MVVCDRFGQQRQLGGDRIDVRIAVTGNPQAEVIAKVSDSGDGRYKVLYSPWVQGELLVSVLVAGKHIRGSPFQVDISPSHTKT